MNEYLNSFHTRTGGRPATKGVIPGRYALSVGMPSLPAPEGWRWILLSDIAKLESGHTPSRKVPAYWGGDIPWVGIRDATENHGRIIFDTYQHTNELGILNSSARILPTNTVCLSRTASVGYVIVMGRPMATSQDFVNWVCSPAINHEYLKYVLLVEHDSLLRFASGTTHQTIYFPEAKAFHVCLPPLPEQRAIAHILGSLDAKIELNRQMNATLEAIARALFQSWFVDFDPVHAKANGQPPVGMDAETAALFPDSFEETEIGLVPRGWKIATLSEYADLNPESWSRGTAPSEILYVDLANTKWGRIEEMQRFIWKDAPSRAQRILRPGDTIVGTVRPGNGSFTLISEEGLTGSTGFAVLRPRKTIYEEYIYLVATSPDNIELLSRLADGGAYPAVRPDVVLATQTVQSSESLLKFFSNIVKPLMSRIAANQRESRTLAELRDTLLPKLMSGQLRVPEAAEMTEAIP